MRRLGLVAALLALLLPGAPAGGQEWIAGKLLVATETMGDPNFAETVIYMFEHDESGAAGVVLNRPLDTLPLGRLLDGFGLGPADAAGDVIVYAGGPVFPDNAVVLHDDGYATVATETVGGGIAVTASPRPLEDRAAGRGPDRLLFFLGLAGWGPGQLEGELATGAWAVVPADADFVFDAPRATLWQAALARRGVDL